ncbi:MAG: hypothetical protein IPG59_01780 [Candidatus Melainabacteria bacterium]|nr:MAG: hypothetical protein IPG59_01780 [Candidatus Melainabacteria bacterium]
MKPMKLYHAKELMGTIEDVGMDGLWMIGNLTLISSADKYKEMLDFLVDEKRNHVDPPYPIENLEGWSVEDDAGIMKEIIGPPAITNNYSTIAWRW